MDTARHDADWYREEAQRVSVKALNTSDPALRDRYLQVAEAYERLADALRRIPPD